MSEEIDPYTIVPRSPPKSEGVADARSKSDFQGEASIVVPLSDRDVKKSRGLSETDSRKEIIAPFSRDPLVNATNTIVKILKVYGLGAVAGPFALFVSLASVAGFQAVPSVLKAASEVQACVSEMSPSRIFRGAQSKDVQRVKDAFEETLKAQEKLLACSQAESKETLMEFQRHLEASQSNLINLMTRLPAAASRCPSFSVGIKVGAQLEGKGVIREGSRRSSVASADSEGAAPNPAGSANFFDTLEGINRSGVSLYFRQIKM
jgi:hypothetical protein